MIRTMDFQDSNRDGIDDRDQNYDTRMPAFLLPGRRSPRPPSNRSIQDRLGGIADMIRARDAKGARTPPRPPRGGQSPA